MAHEALPDGVQLLHITPKALSIASEVLRAVQGSAVEVTQLEQRTADVPETLDNGIIQTRDMPLSVHYQNVKAFAPTKGPKRALYMHNKSMVEVVGESLTRALYGAIDPLSEDVLVNYPLLYVSNNPKSSSDVLVGSPGSWSPLHQDLPLYCTSAILVLEGHKEFVVVPDELVPSLPINMCSERWSQPIKHGRVTYDDLPSLLQAKGGAVLNLKPGDLMIIGPRIFHLARNRSMTVSCNFSVCSMNMVPLALAQTLMLIEKSPRHVMHFDADCGKLLDDCTQAVLSRCRVKASTLHHVACRKRLPAVESILERSRELIEWYMTLQCIPSGWVVGFWGPLRDRLLQQLRDALPLHAAAANPPGGCTSQADEGGPAQQPTQAAQAPAGAAAPAAQPSPAAHADAPPAAAQPEVRAPAAGSCADAGGRGAATGEQERSGPRADAAGAGAGEAVAAQPPCAHAGGGAPRARMRSLSKAVAPAGQAAAGPQLHSAGARGACAAGQREEAAHEQQPEEGQQEQQSQEEDDDDVILQGERDASGAWIDGAQVKPNARSRKRPKLQGHGRSCSSAGGGGRHSSQADDDGRGHVWRTVSGYPPYECTSMGAVRSKKSQTLMKPRAKNGEWYVSLKKERGDRSGSTVSVRNMIAATWLPLGQRLGYDIVRSFCLVEYKDEGLSGGVDRNRASNLLISRVR